MTTPYITPTTTVAIPGGLSVTQFIQTVLVGISEVPGPLVRPRWQVEGPKQPDILTNWIAFSIDVAAPDANGYLGVNSDDETESQRHETLEVGLHIYGPEALTTYELLRDGFQIPQNLEALRSANMGFVEIAPARTLPDFVNERWVNRIQSAVFLRREIQRIYPIATLVSANGTIHTVVGGEEYLLNWVTTEEG